MKLDKTLLKYCLYATVTVLLSYIGIFLIGNMGHILSTILSVICGVGELSKPLFVALVIAYLLTPVVNKIEVFLKRKKIFKNNASRRLTGVVLSYVMVLSVFIGILYGIYIMIGGKLSSNTSISNMTVFLIDYLKNSAVSVEIITQKLQSLNISVLGNSSEKIAAAVNSIVSYFITSIGGTAGIITLIGNNLALFFISLILSIYLIQDCDYFKKLWNKIFILMFRKGKAGDKVKEIGCIIDGVFKKYLRGQLLEAFIVGLLSAVVLYIVGVDYALVIGMIAGICNLIPYVGPLVGTVLAVIMSLLSGQPVQAIWSVIGMLSVQQIDNILIAPRIVGDSVGLHPLFTMLAIVIGGSSFGLVGMLIAVPLAASVKILVSEWFDCYVKKHNIDVE